MENVYTTTLYNYKAFPRSRYLEIPQLLVEIKTVMLKIRIYLFQYSIDFC